VLFDRQVEVLLRRCFAFPLFFPLGAPVLEPDLHVGLGEAQRRGDGVTLQHGQVVGAPETVLQDPELVHGERGADPSTFALGAREWTLTPRWRDGALIGIWTPRLAHW